MIWPVGEWRSPTPSGSPKSPYPHLATPATTASPTPSHSPSRLVLTSPLPRRYASELHTLTATNLRTHLLHHGIGNGACLGDGSPTYAPIPSSGCASLTSIVSSRPSRRPVWKTATAAGNEPQSPISWQTGPASRHDRAYQPGMMGPDPWPPSCLATSGRSSIRRSTPYGSVALCRVRVTANCRAISWPCGISAKVGPLERPRLRFARSPLGEPERPGLHCVPSVDLLLKLG